MEVKVLSQPIDSNNVTLALGSELATLLDSRNPFYREIWLISAFADYQSIVRLRDHIQRSLNDQAQVHMIVGVDLQSTSVEALEAILTLGTDAKVVKNKRPGHTFHPKIYLFESDGSAVLIIGSNNLTEGGMFKNYEGSVMIKYNRGEESAEYNQVKAALAPFLNPSQSIVQPLSVELIETLAARGDVLREHQRREIRKQARRSARAQTGVPASPFGSEPIPPPPPLPAEFLRRVARAVERGRVGDTKLPEVTAFYMHLNRLQGTNIPGEARIPLAAREIAKRFWGWPNRYVLDTQRRGTHPRRYHNWKPKWLIFEADAPQRTYFDEVRMYEYEDSADFRFYSRRLVTLGADSMDIVRITRLGRSEGAEFECVLARRGTQIHREWERYCTVPIPNSPRRFGFA